VDTGDLINRVHHNRGRIRSLGDASDAQQRTITTAIAMRQRMVGGAEARRGS